MREIPNSYFDNDQPLPSSDLEDALYGFVAQLAVYETPKINKVLCEIKNDVGIDIAQATRQHQIRLTQWRDQPREREVHPATLVQYLYPMINPNGFLRQPPSGDGSWTLFLTPVITSQGIMPENIAVLNLVRSTSQLPRQFQDVLTYRPRDHKRLYFNKTVELAFCVRTNPTLRIGGEDNRPQIYDLTTIPVSEAVRNIRACLLEPPTKPRLMYGLRS